MATRTISVPDNSVLAGLLGQRDQHLRQIQAAFPDTDIGVRGTQLEVQGQKAEQVSLVFEELIALLQHGHAPDPQSISQTIDMVIMEESPSKVLTEEIIRTRRGRAIHPLSRGQKHYVDAIRDNTVTFAIGPAGTGKSWLAVALAVASLNAKETKRIILTRPAVEAGERLGFLPGDMMSKVDPYLRPLYDALHDMVDADTAQRWLERGTVEVAPLAFMRGRTLNDSFIILDEAQNTTPQQMKMFLTRIGFDSKVVITGDVTQVDVPSGESGLKGLERILADIDDLAFVHLGRGDVVRHPIVEQIVGAYEKADSKKPGRPPAKPQTKQPTKLAAKPPSKSN